MRAARAVVAALLVTAMSASCSVLDQDDPPAGSSTHPAGVLAIGHSGMTGFRSTPGYDGDTLENSWATGTNPEVDSIYARLARVEPADEGKVDNEGIDGSKVDSLLDEAVLGLKQVPRPRLVLVQTIDNDIRCDGTDKANQPVFGKALRAAIARLVSASPHVVILLLNPLGWPQEQAEATLRIPAAIPSMQSEGDCSLIDSRGALSADGIQLYTHLIVEYERTSAQVCAHFRQCHSDGGVSGRFTDFPDWSVPGDWNHLTVAGHARLAKLVWPTVARLLHLRST